MATSAITSAFLGDRPETAFQAAIGGFSPQRRRFFDRQFGDIFGQFQGLRGRQAQAGDLPRGSFSQFLTGFPFEQEFQSFTPFQRGFRPQTFAPGVRRLNF